MREPKISPEFKSFLESRRLMNKPDSIYEDACNNAEEHIKMKISSDKEEEFKNAIIFSRLNISSSGSTSLSVSLGLILIPAEILLFILGLFDFTALLLFASLTFFLLYYLYRYPFLRARIVRTKASSELVLTVLYMAIALRDVPNLENAIKFAASNLTGPISYDLRKLIWDVAVGKYTNVEDALDIFMDKWRRGNEEFIDALEMLRASAHQSHKKRMKMLDESIQVVLNGTTVRMERYSRELKMPVMLTFGIGIILPVMTLIMLPVAMIFLQEIISISFLILFYNVILPMILYWFINMNLERKPPTISQPDVSKSKDVAPLGKFKIGKEIFSILPVAIIVLVIFMGIGIPLVYENYVKNSMCRDWIKCDFKYTCKPRGLTLSEEACKIIIADVSTPIMYSLIPIWGISLSFITYSFLNSVGKTKLRDRVRKIEKEFGVALFQLGYQISGGKPIENALENAKKKLKKYEISKLYEKILRNIKMFGMTFNKAVFDRQYGVIKEYPSQLIDSVLRIIGETSKKGMHLASISMITISKYLDGIHKVGERIRELLDETVSSMDLLSKFLIPLIAGVTVAMTMIVINILSILSLEISELTEGAKIPSFGGFLFGLWKGAIDVSTSVVSLVVGIYTIETTILLSMFINGLKNGEDKISEGEILWKNLLLSTIIFTLTTFLTFTMFGGTISSLLIGPR